MSDGRCESIEIRAVDPNPGNGLKVNISTEHGQCCITSFGLQLFSLNRFPVQQSQARADGHSFCRVTDIFSNHFSSSRPHCNLISSTRSRPSRSTHRHSIIASQQQFGRVLEFDEPEEERGFIDTGPIHNASQPRGGKQLPSRCPINPVISCWSKQS